MHFDLEAHYPEIGRGWGIVGILWIISLVVGERLPRLKVGVVAYSPWDGNNKGENHTASGTDMNQDSPCKTEQNQQIPCKDLPPPMVLPSLPVQLCTDSGGFNEMSIK